MYILAQNKRFVNKKKKKKKRREGGGIKLINSTVSYPQEWNIEEQGKTESFSVTKSLLLNNHKHSA